MYSGSVADSEVMTLLPEQNWPRNVKSLDRAAYKGGRHYKANWSRTLWLVIGDNINT